MSRIYKVSITHGKDTKEKLVRATTKGGAIKHAASRCIEAEVASQDDLIRLASAGEKVEEAVVTEAE